MCREFKIFLICLVVATTLVVGGLRHYYSHLDRSYWLEVAGMKIENDSSRKLNIPYQYWRGKMPYGAGAPNITEVHWNKHCEDIFYFKVFTPDGMWYVDQSTPHFVLAEGERKIEAYNSEGEMVSSHTLTIIAP